MTSVALTKVLFEKWIGSGRIFTAMPPDLDTMLASSDAALLIGDPALQVDRSKYYTLDLAEEWIRYTGKPFVFAFWAVREKAISGLSADEISDLAGIFQRSRDHGLAPESLNQIAREWSPRLNLSEDEVRSYLTQNIYYELDAACLAGLQLFYRYAAEIGALPSAPEMLFLAAANPAIV
jgi:chorismate dehydratase